LAFNYIQFRIAQIFFKDKAKEYEFKLRKMQRLSETGITYSVDVPRRPIGFSVVIALSLMFLYMLAYLIFYLPEK
jgi:hypothetical protein